MGFFHKINESEIEQIKNAIKQLLDEIFEDYDINALSSNNKRKIIFDFFVNNSEYDFSRLNKINSGERNLFSEIMDVLKIRKNCQGEGVCHAYAIVYKLLCEELNIPNILVTCNVLENNLDYLTNNNINILRYTIRKSQAKYDVRHMLNLVDNGDGTVSFDDITEAILNKRKGTTNDYFGNGLDSLNTVRYSRLRYLSLKAFSGIDSSMDDDISEKLLWKDQMKIFFKDPDNKIIKPLKEKFFTFNGIKNKGKAISSKEEEQER